MGKEREKLFEYGVKRILHTYNNDFIIFLFKVPYHCFVFLFVLCQFSIAFLFFFFKFANDARSSGTIVSANPVTSVLYLDNEQGLSSGIRRPTLCGQ